MIARLKKLAGWLMLCTFALLLLGASYVAAGGLIPFLLIMGSVSLMVALLFLGLELIS